MFLIARQPAQGRSVLLRLPLKMLPCRRKVRAQVLAVNLVQRANIMLVSGRKTARRQALKKQALFRLLKRKLLRLSQKFVEPDIVKND